MSSRFQREAQAAGALNHPGIVAVYEYGEDAHYAFIAMEFVEGNNLRDYIANGTNFDEQDTVSIMAQLLDALHYAHNAAVWHRDIKPANIIVMSNGRIKLTDFGIARLEIADRTRTNVIMGTPGYIAPELYLGGQVDHRIDIFAAGVLFYQLLARKSPFRGGPEAIMHDVCYHDPDPASKADPAHRWPQYDAIVARAHRQVAGRSFPERGRVPQCDPRRLRAAGGQHDLRGHDRDAPLALCVRRSGSPAAAAPACRRCPRRSRCRAPARRRPPAGAAWCCPASRSRSPSTSARWPRCWCAAPPRNTRTSSRWSAR